MFGAETPARVERPPFVQSTKETANEIRAHPACLPVADHVLATPHRGAGPGCRGEPKESPRHPGCNGGRPGWPEMAFARQHHAAGPHFRLLPGQTHRRDL